MTHGSCGEGDVIDEGGCQCRDPHNENKGHQHLVLWGYTLEGVCECVCVCGGGGGVRWVRGWGKVRREQEKNS